MEVNEKVKKMRQLNRLTQEQMAEKLHLTLSGYQKLESGKWQFDVAKLECCAAIFGITLSELLSVDENSSIYLVNSPSHAQNGSVLCISNRDKINNTFYGVEALAAENESLKNTIAHQEKEISLLRELLETLKQSKQS